ncbi:MAG: PDZ domain-containing protein, partial [Verrucomicrobiales bacterium]
ELELGPVSGEGKTKAAAFAFRPDLAVSVGVVGADVSAVRSGGEAVQVLIHDPESRLMLLGLSAEQGAKLPELGSGQDLRPGAALSLADGGKSRVVSWVRHFGKRRLPFAFLRVTFGEKIPSPGSPLFDEGGKLVAITHQATPDDEKSCYALPVEVLTRVLGDLDARRPMRRCWVGCHLDSPDAHPVVAGVRPDSPAREAGLQKGDVLLSIDGRRLENYDDVVNAFYYLVAGREVEFEVLRGLETLKIAVVPVVDPRYSLREAEGHSGEGADNE